MHRIIRSALQYRIFVLGLSGVLFAAGLWAWITLKKEAYPDVGDTQVTVLTLFPGRAAKEVESQVTVPLERVLNGIPDLLSRRSKTIFGLSVIELTFQDDVDDYFARQRVLERMATADLPPGAQPQLAPLIGPVGEIFRYVIESDGGQTPMELRTLQDWVVIPKLLQVTGVADVINFGGLVKQFHVVTSPERLARFSLTLQNVIDAITANNVNTGGNIIARGGQGFVVRAMGSISDKTHLDNIVVSAQKGVPIFVKDIGIVQEWPKAPTGVLGYRIREADGSIQDVSSSVQGLVGMLRGQNPSDVVSAVKDKVKEINERWLPPGVRLRITYDRSELVRYTIGTVSHTVFEGISIVLIVLVLFLGSLRAATIVAVTIPISLVFSFLMMKLSGIPASLLSLGAIDFGIIVDGAVVMVENLIRHYRTAPKAGSLKELVALTFEGASEVSREIFFSITIIILAYLPILTMQRVEGKLFRPMAYSLGFAILGSLLLSLTVIPVLMTYIYDLVRDDATTAQHEPEWFEKVRAWYETLIHRLLHNPRRVLAWSGGSVAVITLLGYFFVGSEFLPNLDEGAFNIRCFFPVGITLKEASTYAPLIRQVIGRNPPVSLVTTQLGRNDDGTDPYGPNRMEILVGLRDYRQWDSTISKGDLLWKIKRDLQRAIPGALFSFSQPIMDNVTERVTGSVADLAVLVNGEDLKTMRRIAKDVYAQVKQTPGATETGIEQEADQAQLTIDVDRSQAARHGINVADIQRMIEAAIGGSPIGKVVDGERRFDIVVRYSADYRSSIHSIERLQIPSVSGAKIPLRQLAHIRIEDGPTIIQRQDGRRQISVRTNIRGRDQGSFVADARRRVEKNITLPQGYDLTWGGQFENLSRASKRLFVVIPITLLIICSLLLLLYRDWRSVACALSGIPLSLVGGVAALIARGYHFNVSAGVGLVSLFGISTMSGILFVSRAHRLKSEEPGLSLLDVTARAASLQLRPRLMTILLALLGLVPAALATGIGSDVQRPLATVVVGGLLSVLLTLAVLPVLYFEIEASRREPA